jgi:uncharacterized protein involved in exopolysaccharide biosynthesis
MSEHTATPAPTDVHDDEISLLDLLATVTENLRLLILGPLLVGLVALGISFTLTPTYESRSVLRLGEGTTALLASEDLLTPLLPAANWLPTNGPRSAQLKNLSELIKPSFNKKDGTLTLTVSGPSPEQAQRLHLAAMEELRKQSLPKGRSLEQIEQRRVAAQATLDELNGVLPALSQNVVRPSTDSEASSRAYSLLLQQRLSAEQTLTDLANSLKPFGDEVFAQTPTLPDRSVKPKKGLIAVLATLSSGFVLLIWVFLRQAMRNAARNPQDAERLAAIRSNLARSVGIKG